MEDKNEAVEQKDAAQLESVDLDAKEKTVQASVEKAAVASEAKKEDKTALATEVKKEDETVGESAAKKMEKTEYDSADDEKGNPANAIRAAGEFSYTERQEFTSEIFKVEVNNMGYFGMGEFKKLLKKKLNLDMCKIKSFNQKDRAYVCFRSAADQQRAISLLNGFKWKGKILEARAALASADPLIKKRRKEAEATASEPVAVPEAKKSRTSADATVPLASLSYEQQLELKREKMVDLLSRLRSQLLRTNNDARDFVDAFNFLGVEPSPQINGYRNKCEFTVGRNDKDDITVGFRLSSYADGSVEVSEVDDLPHLPDAAKWAAKSFQEFVRQSQFAPFNPETNKGHFRQLMVRTSELTGELMLVPGLYCSNLTADQVEQIKNDMTSYYMENADPKAPFKCTSLYFQDVQRRTVGQMICPVDYIAGEKVLTDAILGLKYRISPLAFFQVNTKSTEVLYKKAIELAAPLPHSTMLDVCCGTGTIALTFAKHCKKVLGVDIVSEAILDANVNAGLNEIDNCKFYTGNADEYIGSMAKEVVYGTATNEKLDLFAVVDPPRAGLHVKSICALRAAAAIKRLVYISCNPERAMRNFVDLGRPQSKQYKGHPFFPKTAVAVDMFPHTTHTELVVLFERCVPLEDAETTNTAQPVEASTSEKPTTETKTVDTKGAEQTSAASTSTARTDGATAKQAEAIVTPMETEATAVTPAATEATAVSMETETSDPNADGESKNDENPNANGTNGTEQRKAEKPE